MEVSAALVADAKSLELLAAKYGLELGRPTWLPDVISRFDLTPPPGA